MMKHEHAEGSRRRFLRTALATSTAAALALRAGRPARAAEDDIAEQIVDAMNALFGKHPGFRAAHAKGTVCEGTFTPAATAPSLSKAAHLRDRVAVTARFSNGSGVPNAPDNAPISSPHGLAIRFHLPGGGLTDIVSNSFNGFAVSTPEDFLAFLRAVAASGPDAAKPTALDQFLASHPKARKAATTPKPDPVSFGTLTWFGVNAFRFTNAEGKSRFGRYRIVPIVGDKRLDGAEAEKKPANYLFDELDERLAKGPVEFWINVQLANDGDPVDDPAAVWPDDRQQVQLGLLSITKRVADSDAAERKLFYDPNHLTDGIEASDDPILEIRSPVYAISARRRRK
jgi:catalase